MMGVGGSDPSGTWKFEYNSAVASLVAQLVKNLPAVGRPGFHPWVGKIPWRREWLSASVVLPGEFHGQRSLTGLLSEMTGYKESDMTERLSLSL